MPCPFLRVFLYSIVSVLVNLVNFCVGSNFRVSSWCVSPCCLFPCMLLTSLSCLWCALPALPLLQ